jgi:hypothetical protein
MQSWANTSGVMDHPWFYARGKYLYHRRRLTFKSTPKELLYATRFEMSRRN